MSNPKDVLTEQELDHLVELDMAAQEDSVAAGTPAIVSAVTAVTALATTSGLCPSWACTTQCQGQ
ncbi:hypothetical protein [Rothia dentocariosa]|jgi:hypothetical protein